MKIDQGKADFLELEETATFSDTRDDISTETFMRLAPVPLKRSVRKLRDRVPYFGEQAG
jgi:hypothetical protein